MLKTSLFIFALLLGVTAAADDVAVTVYNSNLGVVTETRTLDLEKGVNRLEFKDVPSQIDASSVRFNVPGSESDVTILEQNYAFDLVSPSQLYSKYVDELVELIDKEGHLIGGTLLAYSGNSVTLLDDNGKVRIVSLENVAEVDFPALPDGLITRPTLFWLYKSDISGEKMTEVAYQTQGMNWQAEYVGVLDEDEKNLDLSGWASLNNTSGKTYRDATLKLIAGDIHRAQQPTPRVQKEVRLMAIADAESGSFEEKPFFEYHMYTLPRKATLADKEIKQISLFDPASTGVEKVYLYNSSTGSQDVAVKIEFVNSEEAGLGMPLPAGRVRLFKSDSDGSLVLLGEDRIDHTPRKEKLSLTVGNAFDLKAEEKMLKQTRISDRVEERSWEVELRNRKDEPVTIIVEKGLWGFWEITQSSHEAVRKDARTVRFSVPVAADSTTKLTFTARFSY